MIGCANVQKMSEKHYGLCVECVTLPVIQPCNTRVTPEYKTENFIFFPLTILPFFLCLRQNTQNLNVGYSSFILHFTKTFDAFQLTVFLSMKQQCPKISFDCVIKIFKLVCKKKSFGAAFAKQQCAYQEMFILLRENFILYLSCLLLTVARLLYMVHLINGCVWYLALHDMSIIFILSHVLTTI